MYKFSRKIYVGNHVYEMWFGLTSKSQDRHSNFTLYLLTEGPNNQFSYAEKIESGFFAKADAERYAIRYARELIRNKIAQENTAAPSEPVDDSVFDE